MAATMTSTSPANDNGRRRIQPAHIAYDFRNDPRIARAPPEVQDRMIDSAARLFYDIGVQATDLTLAQNCILQSIAIFKQLYPNISTNGTLRGPQDHVIYQILRFAQLRLGQIAAYQGRLDEAMMLFKDILLDKTSHHESNKVLRMIAWYDVGVIWMMKSCIIAATTSSNDQSPEVGASEKEDPQPSSAASYQQASLGCFQQSLASCTADDIIQAINSRAPTAATAPISENSSSSTPSETKKARCEARRSREESQQQQQERLAKFHPILMDHIEFLTATLHQQQPDEDSNPDALPLLLRAPENSFLWSLEILLPSLTTNSTAVGEFVQPHGEQLVSVESREQQDDEDNDSEEGASGDDDTLMVESDDDDDDDYDDDYDDEDDESFEEEDAMWSSSAFWDVQPNKIVQQCIENRPTDEQDFNCAPAA